MSNGGVWRNSRDLGEMLAKGFGVTWEREWCLFKERGNDGRQQFGSSPWQSCSPSRRHGQSGETRWHHVRKEESENSRRPVPAWVWRWARLQSLSKGAKEVSVKALPLRPAGGEGVSSVVCALSQGSTNHFVGGAGAARQQSCSCGHSTADSSCDPRCFCATVNPHLVHTWGGGLGKPRVTQRRTRTHAVTADTQRCWLSKHSGSV